MTPWEEGTARYVYADCELSYAVPSYFVEDDAAVLGVDSNKFFGFTDQTFLGVPDEALLLRYVSRVLRHSTRLVGTPANYFNFCPDPDENQVATLILEGAPLNRPTTELTVVWHQVPYSCVPFSYIDYAQGCVNDAPFDVFYGNYATGAVLFSGAEVRQLDLPTGQIGYDESYKFQILPNWAQGIGDGRPYWFIGGDLSGTVASA